MKLPFLTILIADDNRDLADSLAMLLELGGHRAIVAYNGSDAADIASRHCPQMAILDIHMPGLDGLNTARALRHDCDGLVYIVAQSGVDSGDAALHAQRAGFDRFLVKPVSADSLHEIVLAAQDLAVSLEVGSDPAMLHPALVTSASVQRAPASAKQRP